VIRRQRGVSLLEAVFVVGLLLTLAMTTVAGVGEWRARSRVAGAARFLLTHVRLARALAVREGSHVALVFTREADGDATFRLHRDGNDNGVRLVDVESGVDPPVGSRVRLGDYFSGVAFGVPVPLPPIEEGAGLPAGTDPVRLSGGGRVLSCAPTGGLTGGSLYVSGRAGQTFAVRLLGGTGRLRLFEYSAAESRWVER
jgi:hypothetical protein